MDIVAKHTQGTDSAAADALVQESRIRWVQQAGITVMLIDSHWPLAVACSERRRPPRGLCRIQVPSLQAEYIDDIVALVVYLNPRDRCRSAAIASGGA